MRSKFMVFRLPGSRCSITAAIVATLLVSTVLVQSGCVSNRYRQAEKGTPPPVMLDLTFPRAPVEAVLATVITYNGPGSWKRDAFWDEYAVTLRNPGLQPLTVVSASLIDPAGATRSPGSSPWALERESKTREQEYKDAGMAFVRYTAPGVLIVGSGAAVVGSAGFFSATAATAAAVTVIALPAYYVGVLTLNHRNKREMESQFDKRRLALPLTLAPGETRTGSFFFPMTPSPRALALRWSSAAAGGESVLSLDVLQGLHLEAPAPPEK